MRKPRKDRLREWRELADSVDLPGYYYLLIFLDLRSYIGKLAKLSSTDSVGHKPGPGIPSKEFHMFLALPMRYN